MAVNVVVGTVQLNARPLLSLIPEVGGVLSNVVVTLEETVHPFDPVTVTVKVPAVLTLIDEVMAPVDHE